MEGSGVGRLQTYCEGDLVRTSFSAVLELPLKVDGSGVGRLQTYCEDDLVRTSFSAVLELPL